MFDQTNQKLKITTGFILERGAQRRSSEEDAATGGLHVSRGCCQWRSSFQQGMLSIEAFMSAWGVLSIGGSVSNQVEVELGM